MGKTENCGRPWVAEIQKCIRCGLNAEAHLNLTQNKEKLDEKLAQKDS